MSIISDQITSTRTQEEIEAIDEQIGAKRSRTLRSIEDAHFRQELRESGLSSEDIAEIFA